MSRWEQRGYMCVLPQSIYLAPLHAYVFFYIMPVPESLQTQLYTLHLHDYVPHLCTCTIMSFLLGLVIFQSLPTQPQEALQTLVIASSFRPSHGKPRSVLPCTPAPRQPLTTLLRAL